LRAIKNRLRRNKEHYVWRLETKSKGAWELGSKGEESARVQGSKGEEIRDWRLGAIKSMALRNKEHWRNTEQLRCNKETLAPYKTWRRET
jgi:hypothetical protein